MRRENRVRMLWLCALLWAAPAQALESITVLAESNLQLVVSQLARNYAREKNLIVGTSFAPASAQAVQIDEGSPADILITAQARWIDELKTRGLVDVYSQATIARDRLALVGPAESPVSAYLARLFPVADVIRALGPDASFLMPSPETLPEGGPAKEALRGADAADYLEPYTVYLKQRDEMRQLVAEHGAYGVFVQSAAKDRAGIKIIDVFPESLHRPVYYYAVAIAGENMDEARKFIDYLGSKKAAVVWISHGFAVE